MKYYYCLFIYLVIGCCAMAQQQLPKDTAQKKAAVSLDSVVVFNSGYQVLSKNRSTGSFTQVDNKTLNLQTGNNILNRLEGVVPSVAINKHTNSAIPAITVRGLSTINGPASPLIILDNFPYEGDINTIDPDLVESITLLKDATAASIWGTKAGNGVIVINTKKAKLGQPVTTNFSAGLQASSPPDMHYKHTISSGDYIDMEKMLFAKGYYTSLLSSIYHEPVSPVVEILDQQSRGIISNTAADAAIQKLRGIDVRDQYERYMYQSSLNNQYALSFSGGTNTITWLAAGSYDKGTGSLSEKYERSSVRFENTFRPVKQLKINTSIYYIRSNTVSGKPGYAAQTYLYPYSSLRDDNGTAMPVAYQYRLSFTDTLYKGKLLDWNFYPADDYQHSLVKTNTTNLVINVGAQYQLGGGFNIETKYQYEKQQSLTNNLQDAQSYYARNLINGFSQVNSTTGVVTYIAPMGGIYDQAVNNIQVFNLREQLNFNRSFNRHQLSAIAGSELRDIHTQGQSFRTYGYNPVNISGVGVDYRNTYPALPNGDYQNIPYQNDFTDQTKKFVSFYANAAYSYNGKYHLTLSGRRDASNLFGATTNSKWTPLWSAGAAWDISKEAFYKSSLIPHLKLRATYGYTGNADPKRTAVVTVFNIGNSLNTGFPYAAIQQFPNPTLKWETVAITNIGIDFAGKNNRISGSLEWYHKKATDLFANFPIDITTGLGGPTVVRNVASMKSNGVDIVLNRINTKGKFQWNTTCIISANADKVTTAYMANPIASAFVNDGDKVTAVQGKPIHALYSYKWGGLDPLTGNPQGYLKDKLSTDYAAITGSGSTFNDLDYNGSAIPQIFGSLYNSLAFRQFELQVNISYKFRYFFKSSSFSYTGLFNGTDKKGSDDYTRRWQQPGDEAFTNVPSMVYPAIPARDLLYNSSSSMVQKGDHIRLQFINLAYTLMLKRPKQLAAQRIQFFAGASNLGILWRANKKGLDPDYSPMDIPPSATYALGVKCTFQ
ncbi:SusC/RagA family TonB-linked outer membrane protein [Ferruginibacter sp. SUN106]|uniref:SusC/RagA family TonB-linked outer membrane protein n=1 Tax=Ferruginibacter sp. SUN106 TaxID=2978348 RepID=UPI003D36CF18